MDWRILRVPWVRESSVSSLVLRTSARVARARSVVFVAGILLSGCSCGSSGDAVPSGTGGGGSPAALECGSCCLEVESPGARSCEALLSGLGGGEARFADGVRGTVLAKGERQAVAFTSRADRPVSGPAVAFGSDAGACPVEKISATCYDVQGRVISGSGLRFVVRGTGR
jgi:hypothetical protein